MFHLENQRHAHPCGNTTKLRKLRHDQSIEQINRLGSPKVNPMQSNMVGLLLSRPLLHLILTFPHLLRCSGLFLLHGNISLALSSYSISSRHGERITTQNQIMAEDAIHTTATLRELRFIPTVNIKQDQKLLNLARCGSQVSSPFIASSS